MGKNIQSKICMRVGCGDRLVRANVRYAHQYCKGCLQDMKTLRRLRQPCSFTDCTNPAHEDGYCDRHHQGDPGRIPFREDWLRKVGLTDSRELECRYCPDSKGVGICDEHADEIHKIWSKWNTN